MPKLLQSLMEDSVLDFNISFKELLEAKLQEKTSINESSYSDTIIDSLEAFAENYGKLGLAVVASILNDTNVDYTIKGKDLNIHNKSNDDTRITNFMNTISSKKYVSDVAKNSEVGNAQDINDVSRELQDFIEFM